MLLLQLSHTVQKIAICKQEKIIGLFIKKDSKMKNILRDYQNDAHFSTGLLKQIKRTMFFQQIAEANWCDFSSKQWKKL